MSANGSPNVLTVKLNRELCRAVEKQSILYDLNHEHYRKRILSENCWDLVASETGVSGKCSVAKRGVRIRAYRYRMPSLCCDTRAANELAARVVLRNGKPLRLNYF